MNPFSTLARAALRLESHLRHLGHRLKGVPDHSNVMLTLLRPQLGDTPPNLRRLLEPVVASMAILALGGLAAVGMMTFTVFLLACALIYGILTQVFGIEVGLKVPYAQR